MPTTFLFIFILILPHYSDFVLFWVLGVGVVAGEMNGELVVVVVPVSLGN